MSRRGGRIRPGRTRPRRQAGIGPHKRREGHIPTGAHAAGRDARRISDLFDLNIASSNRYLDPLAPPDLSS